SFGVADWAAPRAGKASRASRPRQDGEDLRVSGMGISVTGKGHGDRLYGTQVGPRNPPEKPRNTAHEAAQPPRRGFGSGELTVKGLRAAMGRDGNCARPGPRLALPERCRLPQRCREGGTRI